MKPHTFFLYESAFPPFETSESADQNRIFLKPLSRMDFLGGRLVFLKPDIFEANYVINSGPVLNENFQVQNGGQQFCGRQQLPISN